MLDVNHACVDNQYELVKIWLVNRVQFTMLKLTFVKRLSVVLIEKDYWIYVCLWCV